MKRSFKICIIIIALAILCGCRGWITTELSFNTGGGGEGTLTLTDVDFSETSAEQDLKKAGFQVLSKTKTQEETKVKIRWDNFGQVSVFNEMNLNRDGTVTIDCGHVSNLCGKRGEVIIRVPGAVTKTSGELLEGNRVRFTTGNAILTYRPTLLYVILTALGLGIVGFALWYLFLRKRDTLEKELKEMKTGD